MTLKACEISKQHFNHVCYDLIKLRTLSHQVYSLHSNGCYCLAAYLSNLNKRLWYGIAQSIHIEVCSRSNVHTSRKSYFIYIYFENVSYRNSLRVWVMERDRRERESERERERNFRNLRLNVLLFLYKSANFLLNCLLLIWLDVVLYVIWQFCVGVSYKSFVEDIPFYFRR